MPDTSLLRQAFFGSLLGLSLIAGQARADVVVSSKIDTEGSILGNIIIDVLNAHGVKTHNRLQLGGTPIVRRAIIAGEIDIYPEYTGNAAFFFNKASQQSWKNAAQAYAQAKSLDFAAHKIVWLTPAPADNSWGLAIRQDVAQANHLKTLSDFSRYVAAGGTVKLAASSEFVNAPAALPAFETTYGFTLRPDQLVTLSGGDTAATIAAAGQGTNGVNTAMVYDTDGGIGASGLVVLVDNRHVQPVYQPAAIIRASVLAQYPQIAAWLKPVFLSLTLTTLRTLNGKAEVDGVPAEVVAADYLKSEGFVK
ncbi:MAG TPA: ABC transporter substrate-binding protein [Acidocella sp.]|nr:ABC transporter substrate-binding protein [Acidocella sp.]